MSSVIEVEIDLENYKDEIEDFLNGGIKEQLADYVKEIEKYFYFYADKHKQFKSYEEIYRDLDRIIKEN